MTISRDGLNIATSSHQSIDLRAGVIVVEEDAVAPIRRDALQNTITVVHIGGGGG